MAVDKRNTQSADGELQVRAEREILSVKRHGKRSQLKLPKGVTVRSVIAHDADSISIELELWGLVRHELGLDTAPLHVNIEALMSLEAGVPALCRLLLAHGVSTPGIEKQAKAK